MLVRLGASLMQQIGLENGMHYKRVQAFMQASVLRWIQTVTSPGRGGRSLEIKETGVTVRNLCQKSGMPGLWRETGPGITVEV